MNELRASCDSPSSRSRKNVLAAIVYGAISNLVTSSSISCAMPWSWRAVRMCLRAVTKYIPSLRGTLAAILAARAAAAASSRM